MYNISCMARVSCTCVFVNIHVSHVVFVRRATSRSSSSEDSLSSPKVKSEKGEMREVSAPATSPFDTRENPLREEKKEKKKDKEKEKDRSRGRSRSRSTHKKKRDEKEKKRKDEKQKEKKEKEKKPVEEKKKSRSSSREDVVDTTLPPPEPQKPPRGDNAKKPHAKGWTYPQKQKCTHCGQKIAANKSALDQRQKFSEYCLSWQMYSRMSKQAQKAPDSWQRAQQAARKIKLSRERAAVEEVGCAPSPERSVSPCSLRSSSARAASVAPSVVEVRPQTKQSSLAHEELRALKSESLDQAKTEKGKKSKRKSSSSSEETGKKAKEAKGAAKWCSTSIITEPVGISL